jgi:hypothetical protein
VSADSLRVFGIFRKPTGVCSYVSQFVTHQFLNKNRYKINGQPPKKTQQKNHSHENVNIYLRDLQSRFYSSLIQLYLARS